MKDKDEIIDDYRDLPVRQKRTGSSTKDVLVGKKIPKTPIAQIKENIEDYLGIFKSPEKAYFEDDITEIFSSFGNGSLDYSVYSIVVEPNPYAENYFVAQHAILRLDDAHDFEKQSEQPFWGFELLLYDLTLYSTLKLLSELHHGSRFRLTGQDLIYLEDKDIDVEASVIQAFPLSAYKHIGSLLCGNSKLMQSELDSRNNKQKDSKLKILFD